MHLNSLAPQLQSRPNKKRVGRGIGSGLGKTCGRGHKGQKSRSGGSVKPGFEGGQMPIQRRVPKFGFTSRVGRVSAEVRTSELNALSAETITLDVLKSAGLIRKNMKRAKVVFSGDLTKSIKLSGEIGVTKGARVAIEAKGGTIS